MELPLTRSAYPGRHPDRSHCRLQGMRDSWLPSQPSFQRLPGSAVWCINSAMCGSAIAHRERKEVSMESAAIFKQEQKEEAVRNLAAIIPPNTRSATPKPSAASVKMKNIF